MHKAISLAVLACALSVSSVEARGFRHAGYRPLSRAVVVPLPPRRMESGAVYAMVTQAAARHGVPASLAHGVIRVESNYQCHVRNASGASGLGQLMPATARAMGVRNVLDCAQNLEGSMAYLARMYRAAGGNHCAAATGYNQGHVGGCSAYGIKVIRSAGA